MMLLAVRLRGGGCCCSTLAQDPESILLQDHDSTTVSPSKVLASRILGAQDEPTAVHRPLDGFETVKLVSFEEPCVPIGPLLASLPTYIHKCTELVRERATVPPVNRVDRDSACALTLYTAGWDEPKESFYFKLNAGLRAQDGSLIHPFLRMLKLCMRGLTHLEPYVGNVWRGVHTNMCAQYPLHEEVTWWAFSSATTTMRVLEEPQFLGPTGERTLFMISTSNGYNIQNFSFVESETEILLPPGLTFKVTGHINVGNGLTIIQMQQVESPLCLLHTTSLPAPTPVFVQSIKHAVGPEPTDRKWRDEYTAMRCEQVFLMCGQVVDREAFGPTELAQCLCTFTPNMEAMLEIGWPRAASEAYAVIANSCRMALARAVRDRDPCYAATTHLLCKAISQKAQELTTAMPRMYKNLTGLFGLATEGPEWEALLEPNAAPGMSFVTTAIVPTAAPGRGSFPNDQGYHKSCHTPTKGWSWELQDSDIVCFLSAPADSNGQHSLVPLDEEEYLCVLPPLATVTLERVDQPGQWELIGSDAPKGLRVKRRLFSVRMTYDADA